MKQILVLSLLCLTGCGYDSSWLWYVKQHNCKIVENLKYTQGEVYYGKPIESPLYKWECDTGIFYEVQ